jgi:hypothetical protein
VFLLSNEFDLFNPVESGKMVCRCKCCKCRRCGKCCKCCICIIKEDCCDNRCCKEKCDIIESIALQEAGLAHILNAEGEKIQKAVKIASSICELLRVNQSVIETVDSVTRLELALISKLREVHISSDSKKER